MMQNSDFGQLLYGSALHDIRWNVFDREADLVFDRDKSRVIVRLSGLHLLCFRQSLHGPMQTELRQDCPVHLAIIESDSEFVNAFLKKQLGFSSDVILFDAIGRDSNDDAFQKPQHVLVVCGRGHLDAICEVVSVRT